MFLTKTLFKTASSKRVLVLVESRLTGHRRRVVKDKGSVPLEVILYDPIVRDDQVYKEIKKLVSL